MSTFFAVMAVLLFVTILGGVTGILTVDKIKSLFAKPTNQRLPLTSQRISPQELQVIILHKIENIAEFGVLKQTFNSSFIYHDDRKIFGLSMPLTNNEIKINYAGEVVCGCDMSRAVYAQDSYSNKIKIIIPSGKILRIHELPETVKPEKVRTEIFSRAVDIEKYNRELQNSLDDMRRHLISDGILQRANERVRTSLTKLIASINHEIQTEIIFMSDTSNQRLNSADDLPRLNG